MWWELTTNMDSQADQSCQDGPTTRQPCRDHIKPDNQSSPTKLMDHFRKFRDETELRKVV
jgi:hypothetical protein